MLRFLCVWFFCIVVLFAPMLVMAQQELEMNPLIRARMFNVKEYGAVLDGKADDAPAIMAAFQAMKVNGKPSGTLLIPGVARIASTLDFDGGFRNVTNEGQWKTGNGEEVVIEVTGALRPDAGIGVAVKLHGMRNAWTSINFDGGGKESDIALQVEDLDLCDIAVTGNKFAGTLLYADASADRTKRIRSTKIRQVFASNCGRAIFWRGIEAFGSFEMVWDRDCVNGSVFQECADVGIQHYENFSPASHSIGLHFIDCNMFNIGVLTLGDRASEALVQITGGDFGSIQRIRASSRPNPPAGFQPTVGLRLLNVKSVSIDNLQTMRCRIGLHVIGSNAHIKMHNSLTSDINPLVVEGNELNRAPRLQIGAWYRYTLRESVKILDSVTGGRLSLSGAIYDMNINNAPDLYAIDCRSEQMILDVSGLVQESRTNLVGAIYHPTPENVRGVGRARIGNPLRHGTLAERPQPLPVETVLSNDREQTLHLWVTVRYQPAVDAPANCLLRMGRSEEEMLDTAQGNYPANSPAATHTLYLRVPPWWQYQALLSNATIEKVVQMYE